MSKKPNRREVLTMAASFVAAAALPMPAIKAGAATLLPKREPLDLLMADIDLSIRLSGCGAACDCCWYMRVDCAWCFCPQVRKLGDKFLLYDHNNNVVGEADPGYKPLPEEEELIAKEEYAMAHNLICPIPATGPRICHAE